MDNVHMHPVFGAIPPVFEPALPDAIVATAERIASYMLDGNDYGSDWPTLYRHVRMSMYRSAVCDIDHPTLDDEAISEGIVRAINAR